MATTVPGAASDLFEGGHVHTDDRTFIRKYIFSTDHKIIGIQFLIMSLTFLLLGGTLAMLMRWQLGFPGQPIPGGTVLPEGMAANGVVLPEFYNSLVTMHGTFMVFFAIMPLLVGLPKARACWRFTRSGSVSRSYSQPSRSRRSRRW